MSAAWSGSALAIGGGQVILSPEAAALALFLLRVYVGASARNGGGVLSPAMQELRDALQSAANTQRPPELDEDHEPVDHSDLIDMREAGAVLGVTDRQARVLTSKDQLGPVVRAGRSKLVHRAEVEALKCRRERR